MAQMLKNLPAMPETRVRFLGRDDPLEKGTATYSSVHAWRIPMDKGAWRAVVPGVAKSWTRLNDFHFTSLSMRLGYPILVHRISSADK